MVSKKWRGARQGSQQSVQHRWQQRDRSSPLGRTIDKRRGRRWRIGLLLACVLVLVAFFVNQLLFSIVQTPIIAIVATDYGSEFEPNAWAREDLDQLEKLCSHNTLQLIDISESWNAKIRGFSALDQQLERLATESHRLPCIVIYISMHGATDGEGNPCLIPPGASPVNTDSWVPVGEIFEHIKRQDFPADLPKLVVFDSNRLFVDWRCGILANRFADRLEDVLQHADIPNLVVLNSCRSGQRGWASSHLQGSTFGHFFTLGLAGVADQTDSGGNNNHRISVRELHQYLVDHVDQWALSNRGDRQRPMLLPENAEFELAQRLNRNANRQLRTDLAAIQPSPSGITREEILGAWEKYQQLDDTETVRYDPLRWGQTTQKLLWLQLAHVAGRAYQESARLCLNGLNDELSEHLEAIQNTDGDALVFSRRKASCKDAIAIPVHKDLHSIPLAEFFGNISSSDSLSLKGHLASFEETPVQSQLDLVLQHLEATGRWTSFSEVHFLRLLENYQFDRLWHNSQHLSQMVSLRNLAEATAVPGDVRVWHKIAGTVGEADHARRLAEDWLFIDTGNALENSAVNVDSALSYYAKASLDAQNLIDAHALSDQLRIHLPSLVRWTARPLSYGQSSAEHDLVVNNQALPLLKSLNKLEGLLEQQGSKPEELNSLVNRIFELDSRLRRHVADTLDGIATLEEMSSQSWREVNSLLELTTLSLAERRKLMQIRDSLEQKLAAESSLKDANENGTTSVVQESYRDRIDARWRMHPLMELLWREFELSIDNRLKAEISTGELDDGSLGLWEQQVRNVFRSASEERQESLEGDAPIVLSDNRSLQNPETVIDSATRGQLVVKARRSRAIAALINGRGFKDSVAELRRFDLQSLLLWHARRVLDDFGGPANSGETSLFIEAASDCIDSADRISGETRSPLAERNRVEKLLQDRVQASKGAITTGADNVLLTDPESGVETRVQVMPEDAIPVQAVPPGKAVVYLRNPRSTDRIGDHEYPISMPITIPEEGNPLSEYYFKLTESDLVGDETPLQAITFFRGHVFADPFLFRSIGGRRITTFRPDYGAPSIVVATEHPQRISTIFILDCSQSMDQPIDLELPGNSQQISRLDGAKRALQVLLDQFAQFGNAHVGLTLYGHRVGWNIDEPVQILHQEEYGGVIPNSLQPSEDVENVLPLGRFDDIVARIALELLDTVKPWGETPLYRSLVEALNSFDPLEESVKSIIVITDGGNYQFNSPRPSIKEDVMTAWSQHPVPIHIVGFDDSESAQGAVAREFQELAEHTGGSYSTVRGAASLLKTMETRLAAGLYRVTDLKPDHEINEQQQIGSPIVLPFKEYGQGEYVVRWEDLATQVAVEDGEALRLTISSDGNRMESIRYQDSQTLFVPMVRGFQGSPSNVLLGLHRIRKHDEDVTFRLSFQRNDRSVMPRPQGIWVEITPEVSTENARQTSFQMSNPYVFFDSNYVDGTPVPMLDLVARNWPADASRAAIRCWCHPGLVQSTSQFSLREITGQGVKLPLERSSEVICKARITRRSAPNSPLRIAVEMRHQSDAEGVSSLKLDMRPKADRLMRQFDNNNGLSIHVFYYDSATEEDAQDYQVHVTTREAFQEDAWQVNRSVIRHIPQATGLLELRSALSSQGQ